MAHPQTPESGKENPRHHVPMKHASTQTTDWNLSTLKNTRDASTQTTGVYISKKKKRDASTQTPEDDLSFLEQPPVTSETSEESRKRKISNEEEVTHGSDACKLPRTEISEKSDQFFSSSSEKGCWNPDFKNIISAPSHTLFESSRLASINQEFSNFEESYFKSQELNVPGSSGNTENLRKEENIASNKNISPKEKAPSEKSDTDVSKVTNVCSDDDMLSEQGSSRCHENNSHSKEFVENPKIVSLPSQQPPVETKQKEPTCLTCKKTISEHMQVYDGTDMYRCCHRCCRCLFISDNFECLQLHIFTEHTQPYYCGVCQLNYSETSSHTRGGKCDVCKHNFECKYQLEEHYTLVHKDFYETHCKICKRDLETHNILSNKVLYECCLKECKLRFTSTSSFNLHLSKHSRLKLIKCEVCGYYFKRPVRF